MPNFRKRLCAVSLLIAIIAYVLLGYYTKSWDYPLLVFLIVPFMPFLLGLKKINFTFELFIVILYLALGFALDGWHPWWVLFLTIPVYHTLFPTNWTSKKTIKGKTKKEESKDEDGPQIVD